MMGTDRLCGAALLVFTAAACGGAGGSDTPPPASPGGPTASTPTASTAPTSTAGPATSTAPATSSAPAGAWPFDSGSDASAQLDRLKKDPGPIKSNWTPPGKTDRYGHAEGLVAAAPDAVRSKLTDYGHFKDLAGPKFKSVKVVDKQGQSTDVYFQLPIMKGMITIWYVTRFAPPKAAAGGDVIEGTFVKGNIKGMQIAFTIRPGTDDKSTALTCDLVLQPNVPAPQSAIDEELRDACGDAIFSLRKTLGLPELRPQ